jgi:hypothetical protein
MKNYLIVLALFLSSCVYDPADSRLTIINNSKNGYFIITKVDTALSTRGYGARHFSEKDLLSGDTLDLIEPEANGWHIVFNSNQKAKLYIFLYNRDSIKKHRNIDELTKTKTFEMLEYTEGELDKLDWKVSIGTDKTNISTER